MSAFAKEKSYHPDHLIRNYDWAALGQGLVVDVGGARGHMCKALAKHFPDLSFVVEDLPDVVRAAEADGFQEQPTRIKFVEYDFFKEQPVRDAKLFLFRKIFHDWSDKYVVQILRNLRPALTAGTRVLVQDACAPAPGSGSLWQERQLRTTDMVMLSMLNGVERGLDEWKTVFADADPRFHFISIRTPPESGHALIEYEWRE